MDLGELLAQVTDRETAVPGVRIDGRGPFVDLSFEFGDPFGAEGGREIGQHDAWPAGAVALQFHQPGGQTLGRGLGGGGAGRKNS
jgi:hypothetical protein